MEDLIKVLDKGYVRYIDHMGSDESIVNTARVSYLKKTSKFSEKDKDLIKFLARNGHTSPFRHAIIQFEIKAPLVVMRQTWKYVVGSNHTMDAWNEESRRYVSYEPDFYIPSNDEFRFKEGLEATTDFNSELINIINNGIDMYKKALSEGMLKEQARLFLPAYAMYVTSIWTASLQSVTHFIKQRTKDDAQFEIRQYAKAIKRFVFDKFPISANELI